MFGIKKRFASKILIIRPLLLPMIQLDENFSPPFPEKKVRDGNTQKKEMSGGLRCADNIVAIPNLDQAVPAQGATGQPLK